MEVSRVFTMTFARTFGAFPWCHYVAEFDWCLFACTTVPRWNSGPSIIPLRGIVSLLSRSLLLLLLSLLLLRSSRIRGFCIRHFSLLVGQFCVFAISVSLAIFSKLNFSFSLFFEKENPTIGLFPAPSTAPRAEFFLDSTSILATRESVRRFFAFDRVSEAASDRDWPLCFILKR